MTALRCDCLIVDDEPAIAQATSEYLTMFDVPCAYVTGYDECIEFLKCNEVSLLLLDINLGAQSGFALCKELRRDFDMPILFISARTSDDDVLTALNIGGDDYIKKPYTLSILLAKIKAILKRYKTSPETAPEAAPDDGCPFAVDRRARRVSVNGEPVKLKELEYRLLSYMLDNRNRVLTKDELLENVWKDSFTGEGTIAVHIRRLREKLEKRPDEPEYIKTVWGVGYILEIKK